MSLLSLRLQKKKIIGVDVVLRIRCNTEAVKKLSLPDLPHRAANEKFCCRVENPLGEKFWTRKLRKIVTLVQMWCGGTVYCCTEAVKITMARFSTSCREMGNFVAGKSLGGNFDAEIFYSNCTYSFLDFKKHFSASLSISHVL